MTSSSTDESSRMASIASIIEATIAEARAELCGSWAHLRILLAADIEAAILESRRNFESTTVVKLSGSAVAVAGGVVSVFGFALLMASLAPALPLAIVGTAVAVSGGIGGGAAAVRHAVAEKAVARRVRKHFEGSRCLLDRMVDQLAVALLTQAKRSVHQNRDRQFGSRVCRLLVWLRLEMRSCRQLHHRLLTEAGVSKEQVRAIPAGQRVDQLLTLADAAHECVVETLANEFLGRCSASNNDSGARFGAGPRQLPSHRFDQSRSQLGDKVPGSPRLTRRRTEAQGSVKKNSKPEFKTCENSGVQLQSENDWLGDYEDDTKERLACARGAMFLSKELKYDARKANLQTCADDSTTAETQRVKLDSEERVRLIMALTRAARLTLSLVRISLFGSADAGNLPTGEDLAVSLQCVALHGSLGIAEGVVQGVGRASALSMARVLGTAVGSAASTALDAGLLVYYAKQLHDFRRRGREPELVVQLQAMRQTVQMQHAEVLTLCTASDDHYEADGRFSA